MAVSTVETFYNNFSQTFIRDYIYGNERIKRQLEFFISAIHPETERILVIGCGSGQGAHFIAKWVAKKARILAVDISTENLRLAQDLFSHDRIKYRQVNVVTEAIAGNWDAIVLPDVYEHIPIAARGDLHRKFDTLLSPQGKILFTIPSPGKQAALYASGEGLQVVDEVVTLEDLIEVAKAVGGTLTYWNTISVWNTNDYVHATIERKAAEIGPIEPADQLPIKGLGSMQRNLLYRSLVALSEQPGIARTTRWWKRQRIQKLLSRQK
jgi:SAM-dependent methyltransferase